MSTFSLAREVFEAAQEEFGEPLKLIRSAAYPLSAIPVEKSVQTLDGDGQTLVDTTHLYVDVSVSELRQFKLGQLEHGDRFVWEDKELIVVQVIDRMGYQRARLHQRNINARTW